MYTKMSVAAFALVVGALPAAAQIVVRDPSPNTRRDRTPTTVEDILRGSASTGAESRVPPGHLPPRGLCRVWIEGVAPGHQPPVTDCATAERNRTYNSRVIYGDRDSFPGKAKGKFKNAYSRDRDWYDPRDSWDASRKSTKHSLKHKDKSGKAAGKAKAKKDRA